MGEVQMVQHFFELQSNGFVMFGWWNMKRKFLTDEIGHF